MTSSIFLIGDDGELIELMESLYDSESVLQELLERHPKLLAGDQIDSDEPRKWLLVTREAPVPDSDESDYRWALDHLFLDQDGVPTLIEVKRSTDSRIRRKVIGQMLDYASNAVQYWTVDKLQGLFEKYCGDNGIDPLAALLEFIGEDDDEDFWQLVKTNLQAGRIRCVFVADAIPPELKRVVEFLNKQMDPAEVLAIQVKQYARGNIKTLVPQVIGQTAEAVGRKHRGSKGTRDWDENSILEELEQRYGAQYRNIGKKIFEWSEKNMTRFTFGHGTKDGSFIPVFKHNDISYWPYALWTYGRIEMQFQYLKNKPPFDQESNRIELMKQLNDIKGIDLPSDSLEKRPSFPLSAIESESNFNKFTEALNWVLDQIKESG